MSCCFPVEYAVFLPLNLFIDNVFLNFLNIKKFFLRNYKDRFKWKETLDSPDTISYSFLGLSDCSKFINVDPPKNISFFNVFNFLLRNTSHSFFLFLLTHAYTHY